MNDTPESDEVFGPGVDGVRARKSHKIMNDESYADVDSYTEGLLKENADLERRLIIARGALQQIADHNEYLTVNIAEHALTQTAPKP